MIRKILVPGLASILLASCSGGAPQPAQSAAPAEKPAAQTSSATPASTPDATSAAKPTAERPAESPSAAQPAAAAAAPTFREVTIPAGTSLSVKLLTPLASDTSKVEDPVRGTLVKPVIIDGRTAVPAGAEIVGSVIEAKRSGRVQGRASIAFRFNQLIVGNENRRIQTALVTRQAHASTKQDLKKGGLGAGAGAIIGGIAGGGKGAAIGAVVGGAGTVVATRGEEIRLPAGTTVNAMIRDEVKVLVPMER